MHHTRKRGEQEDTKKKHKGFSWKTHHGLFHRGGIEKRAI